MTLEKNSLENFKKLSCIKFVKLSDTSVFEYLIITLILLIGLLNYLYWPRFWSYYLIETYVPWTATILTLAHVFTAESKLKYIIKGILVVILAFCSFMLFLSFREEVSSDFSAIFFASFYIRFVSYLVLIVVVLESFGLKNILNKQFGK